MGLARANQTQRVKQGERILLQGKEGHTGCVNIICTIK